MGAAKRNREWNAAHGIPEDPFKVRIREPAWAQRRREKQELRGVLIPVPDSTRNDRRRNVAAEGAALAHPLTSGEIEQLHGPIRLHNEGIRRGVIPKNQPLEIETIQETDE